MKMLLFIVLGFTYGTTRPPIKVSSPGGIKSAFTDDAGL